MSDFLIDNVQVLGSNAITPGSVLVRNGRVEAVNPAPHTLPSQVRRIAGGGKLLTPGLIDVHTHGVRQYQYATSPESLIAATENLGQYGTTTTLPTLLPNPAPDLLSNLEKLAGALEKVTKASIPGFHLEGPFVTVAGAACAKLPGDVGLVNELFAACKGRITSMSLAPDAPNIIPVIEALREKNITVFMTHTRASAEQTQAAIDAGASHATHFYDVFPLPAETEPGVRPTGAVEAILANESVSVDFICDGVHVHPMAIRCALAAKTYRGVVLITDSNVGAGQPAGEYPTPWGYSVRVRPGDAARIIMPGDALNNCLAGSVLTMDLGIRNLMQWLKIPPYQIWAMGTANPARLLGLKKKGMIEAGADADLVLWDDSLHAAKTWVGGQLVYEKN